MPLISRWGVAVTSKPYLQPKPSDPKPTTLSNRPLPIDLGSKAESLGFNVSDPTPLKHRSVQIFIPAPTTGPSNISGQSVAIAIPTTGPSGINVSAAVPTTGPSGIASVVAQFNIAPIVSDEGALLATTPPNGTIVNSSDTGALYIYETTTNQWHRFNEE